jgi:hypothetical protein
MIPVGTLPGLRGGGGKRAEEGVNSSVYLLHCKNLWKYSNVSLPRTTTIIIKETQKNKSTYCDS